MRKNITILLLLVLTVSMLSATVPFAPVRSQTFLKYNIDLWYTPTHYGSTEQNVAELVKAQLEATGYFTVTLHSAEWASYLDGLGTMPFFLLGWWFDYPDPSNYIDPFVGSGAFSMGTNYTSVEMDGYIDTMLTDPDAGDRETATINAQNLIAEDVPCVPLFTMIKQFIAYQTDVTGVLLEPSENVHYESMKETGDTQVIIGTTDSINNLDPADCYDYFSSNMLVQLTHGLMEMPRTSTDAVAGPIIDSYSVSPDAITYNFTLKSGIKFSDGTDFNATALQWNFNRSIELNGDPGFLLADVIDNTSVISPTLFQVNLNAPDATFLQRLTYTVAWPISPNGDVAYDTISGDPSHWPAGLGPYKITSWTGGTDIILEPNTYYFGTAPKNDKIIVQFYTGADTLKLALDNGDIDIAHRQFGPDEMDLIMADPSLQYATKSTAGIRYLLFNVDAITNQNVRQAVAAAVHRSQLCSTIFNDLTEPLFSMVPKIFTSHVDAFQNGPNQNHVVGNMTAAGYGYQSQAPTTVTNTQTQTGTVTSIQTTTITPGFEFVSLIVSIFAASGIYVVYRKKR